MRAQLVAPFWSRPIILSAIAAKLKQRAKADFKGRHYEAGLIVHSVEKTMRYPTAK